MDTTYNIRMYTCVYRGCVADPSVNTCTIMHRKLRCLVPTTGHHLPLGQHRLGASAERAWNTATSKHVHVSHRHGQPHFSSKLHAPMLELTIGNDSIQYGYRVCQLCPESEHASEHVRWIQSVNQQILSQ